jgi:hypothetical protein
MIGTKTEQAAKGKALALSFLLATPMAACLLSPRNFGKKVPRLAHLGDVSSLVLGVRYGCYVKRSEGTSAFTPLGREQ